MESLASKIINDEELKAMRKEWNEKITVKKFPLFHIETYRSVEDYKERVRAELDSLLQEQEHQNS